MIELFWKMLPDTTLVRSVEPSALGHKISKERLTILGCTNFAGNHKVKQVRTNIGLADTLIPSSFIYFIYMGGTGPCDSIKIIFGYHVNS